MIMNMLFTSASRTGGSYYRHELVQDRLELCQHEEAAPGPQSG